MTPTNSENVSWPKLLGSINRYGFEMKTMDTLIANQLAIHAVCRSQKVETGNPASSRARQGKTVKIFAQSPLHLAGN